MKPMGGSGRRVSARTLREFGDLAFGYVDLGREALFGASPDYDTVSWESVLRDLESRGDGVAEILDELALRDLEEATRQILRYVHQENPRGAQWPADSILARCCYLLCRLVRPAIVVETGVAYGVSSAFVLQALEENGRGVLHSVDPPPLRRGYARSWGVAVPEELKARWTLHRGTSKRILPGLLEKLGTVDVFLHDSLHTHRNMRREFEAVWPCLRTGGVLIADDVERNRAFGGLRELNQSLWRVVRDREARPLHGNAAPVTFGVVVK
ncbi:MAG: class I SAM-dependent methyltransferase [Actinomycetota bacterium]|nr:class I SAM-dependent methyltransferase [Actinomycetota bacterium]